MRSQIFLYSPERHKGKLKNRDIKQSGELDGRNLITMSSERQYVKIRAENAYSWKQDRAIYVPKDAWDECIRI